MPSNAMITIMGLMMRKKNVCFLIGGKLSISKNYDSNK